MAAPIRLPGLHPPRASRSIEASTVGHWHGALASALALVLAVGAWIAFAPAQLGGQVSFVMIVGTSMEPTMRRGDLAIVRHADSYAVGDVVTYRHPTMGPVIHRIVAERGSRFVLQGDNNSWLDSYSPHPTEILGKLWVHLPHVGGWLQQLRLGMTQPAVVGGAAVILAVAIAAGRATRRAASPPRAATGGGGYGGAAAQLLGENGPNLLGLIAALALGCLVLAVFAFSQPTERTVSDELRYEHTGAFSYSGAVPEGSIYGANVLSTGDPVFRRLVDVITVEFSYRFVSDRAREVSGTSRLIAVVSEAGGWRRAFELQAEAPFTGDRALVWGVVDLAQIQSVLDALEEQTGLRRPEYTLAVIPELRVTGQLGAEKVADAFAPALNFRLDPIQMQLARGDARDGDPLRPSRAGLLKHTRTEANSLSLLTARLDVGVARILAVAGLGLSLAAGLLLGALALAAQRVPEWMRVQARYAPLILTVAGVSLEPTSRVVEVRSLQDLARLAERTGQMILHDTEGDIRRWLLPHGEVTYRYAAPASPAAPAPDGRAPA